MPLNTDSPSDARELAPAPVAVTSGTTPRMNANDVIRMGRNRVRAASTAAAEDRVAMQDPPLARDLDDQDGVLR